MPNTYSFDSPYANELLDIERRRKLADLLQQQAAQPLEANQMAGGYVVPISPLTGLTKLAQGIFYFGQFIFYPGFLCLYAFFLYP